MSEATQGFWHGRRALVTGGCGFLHRWWLHRERRLRHLVPARSPRKGGLQAIEQLLDGPAASGLAFHRITSRAATRAVSGRRSRRAGAGVESRPRRHRAVRGAERARDVRRPVELQAAQAVAVAGLILPGGDTWDEGGNTDAVEKAREFLAGGVPVAAICGATAGLARVSN